jgi:hypothetical protein
MSDSYSDVVEGKLSCPTGLLDAEDEGIMTLQDVRNNLPFGTRY